MGWTSRDRKRTGVLLATDRVVWTLGLLTCLALGIQLGFRASPLIVGLAIVVAAAGLAGFAILGVDNQGAWLALFYVGGNVLIAVYAKTALGQRLESNLRVPVLSFSVLTATSIALLAALLVSRRVPVGRPVFSGTGSARKLAWLSWGSLILGITFWIANQRSQAPGGSGFGGFAMFRDLLLMAVIARTALVLERTGYRKSLDAPLFGILAIAVCLGLLANSKTYAAYPVVSYFATLLFYRRRLAFRNLLILGGAALAFVLVLTPLIQAWRYLGVQQLTIPARVALAERSLTDVFAREGYDRYARLAQVQFRDGYYDYFGANGRGQMLLGRYASVQQIDPVLEQVDARGMIGGAALWPSLRRLLPSALYPNKPVASEAYTILVHYGLIEPTGGMFPTLPLAGQAYAAYGFAGVVVVPFFVFCCVLLALKKFGWSLYRNVYAIFVFSDFIIVYSAQGDLAQYAGLVLRALPLFAIVFWALGFGARLRIQSQGAPARHHVRPFADTRVLP